MKNAYKHKYKGHKMMLIEDQIKDILENALSLTHIEVINDSHKHAGHSGDDGSGQTHFTVILVSNSFKGMNSITRHRKIYELLKPCYDAGLHALSLNTKTPQECAA